MSDDLDPVADVDHRAPEKQQVDAMLKGLPHRYQWDWYAWAWDFYKSTNKMNLLCAANQISKSSTQIRKCIEWSGNPALWPGLWKTKPVQFWYLYPDGATATSEFDTKWVPDFMPRGAYQDHPTYGWRLQRGEKRVVDYIQFNSGVRVYFKYYTQAVKNLQAGSPHAIFCDEELPTELFPELSARLYATDGYFHMVFTATLNQDFWRLAIEGDGEMEKFPDAFKQQVSMRDCLTYRSGKPGGFTEERIRQIEAGCHSQAERMRRVDGRFITETGRKYAQYDVLRHLKKPFDVPGDWKRYCAVDIGSGGTAHPPAISFVAVRPDYRFAVVYKGWRGDDGKDWTNGDTFLKFLEMRGKDLLVLQKFDQQAKDFKTIAERAGETFLPSDKSHERGEDVINTLFKHDMLVVFDTEELAKLSGELTSLMKSTPKKKAKDDFCDSMRYAVVDIPWDWSAIRGDPTDEELKIKKERPLTDKERVAREIEERRGEFKDGETSKAGWDELDAEFAVWNDIAGGT